MGFYIVCACGFHAGSGMLSIGISGEAAALGWWPQQIEDTAGIDEDVAGKIKPEKPSRQIRITS